jgi:N-acetylglucosaminyldiphosphoundecaprenol N-acetyl-beta-D-mannosaminyltransferase
MPPELPDSSTSARQHSRTPALPNSSTPKLPSFKTVSVIGLPVAATTYAGAIEWIKAAALKSDRAYAVEAANTHVAALARHDAAFGKAMDKFDLICPDGMPLVWSVNRQLDDQNKLTDRVYGPTLMLKTIEATQEQPEFKHFLFGGKQSTLDQLQKRFANDYPTTNIAGAYSPPFGEWPEDEFDRICEKIRSSGANLVWVGLGCPKQERWIAEHKDQLPPAVYFGIGAAFAFHAGEVKQAPAWIQKFGVEWLYRLCKEPRRLWRRYFTYNSLFIYYFLRDRMGG